MISTDKNGREVDFQVSGGLYDCVDTYIEKMVYTDTGEEVDEDTIIWFEENRQDEVYEAWFMNQVGRAEYLYG